MISLVRRNVSLLLYMVAMILLSSCGSKMSEDEVKDYISGFTSKYFGGTFLRRGSVSNCSLILIDNLCS